MGGGVGTVQVGWLQTGHLGGEEEEEGARRQSFPKRPSARALPVLQLSGHSLGDATAQQPHQKEDAHAQCDHEQDVVLGG